MKILKYLPLFSFTLTLAAMPAMAADRTADLTVPGSSLVFTGLGLQAPDGEGGFNIGIKLPQPSIKADHCDAAYLVVGMGASDKAPEDLNAADRKLVARKKAYYDSLVAASQHDGNVQIPVRNAPDYLKIDKGVAIAPWCNLSIDKGKIP